MGAPPHAEEGVKTFSKPRAGAAVEGSTFLSVILSVTWACGPPIGMKSLLLGVILSDERSEESKDPYSCKKSEFGRLAQQQIRDYWRL
jgi:hypothetical protein